MKLDCFALKNGRTCIALRQTFCSGNRECVFYKSKEKAILDRQKADEYNKKKGIAKTMLLREED